MPERTSTLPRSERLPDGSAVLHCQDLDGGTFMIPFAHIFEAWRFEDVLTAITPVREMAHPSQRTRKAKCGHDVPSHPGRQRLVCDNCPHPKGNAAAYKPRVFRTEELACSICGSTFVRTVVGPPPTYCSGTCRARAGARRAKEDGRWELRLERKRQETVAKRQAVNPILCIQCGSEFKPKSQRSKLCSLQCAKAYHRDSRTEQCERDDCTKPVRAKRLCTGHYNKTYYPDRSKRWPEDPANKAKRDLVRAKRRRAATRGADAEDVDRVVVGERDRWVCGICLRKVDKAIAYPHPHSQSLDHVIPLSEGGPHTYANTRIAHLECNIHRSDRGGNEQLSLIG